MKGFLPCLLLIIGLLVGQRVSATHIVGGEMTYTRVGDRTYRVQLYLYQDCVTGSPAAIAEDDPAYFALFQNGLLISVDSSRLSSSVLVPPNFSNSCVLKAPNTCLKRATFVYTVTVPNPNLPYRVVYQRCCRNSTIRNIANPGEVGATYYCDIPAIAPENTSAVFKNFPPQIICIDNPLSYDHSATDANGDSLSYEFCIAYIGGSAVDAKPDRPNSLLIPVSYLPPYTPLNPMGGFPQIKIDPVTGVISGTPNTVGRYVVAVCCSEWRNGVRINTVKREFQFVVTNCSKAVVANIPQFSEEFNTYIVQCESKTVGFKNLSTGGFAYHWDFGVPGTEADTSSEFEPAFTYQDTGIYVVKLVVNRGSTCPDSISRLVKVYPNFKADFSVSGKPCPLVPIQFNDQSLATFKPVVAWLWDFGDGTTDTVQNPRHVFDTGSNYKVTLIARSIKGCIDTVTKVNNIDRFVPRAGADTIIVKGERIDYRASGGTNYQWIPSTNLNFTNIPNPTGYYPDTGRYTYVIFIETDNQCKGTDTINIRVVNQGSLYVPTAFSPNGDGINDILRPIGIGYSKVEFFRVFNRYGEMVFNTTKFGEGWDGRNRGKDADIGVYYWVLSVRNRFNERENIKGDATLIR